MNQTDKLYQNRNIKKTIRNEDNRHKNLIVPLIQKLDTGGCISEERT